MTQTCDESVRHNIRTIQLDVTEGEANIKAKADKAAAFWGHVDVLVNNAGHSIPSLIEEGGSAHLRKQYETNVFGLMDVTIAFLPHLRLSTLDPMLVVIGSRSAWKTDIPGSGFYASSKAAVHAFTETLAVELAPKIRVLLVAPGSFRTEGIYRHGVSTSNPIPFYDDLRKATVVKFNSIAGTELGDPEKAMEAVVDVVRGEGVVKGRPCPRYLILGEDAEQDVRTKSNKILDVLDEWKDVICGVSFDRVQSQ